MPLHCVRSSLVWSHLLFGCCGWQLDSCCFARPWQQISQTRDSNTQLLANSIAATGKLGKELSEAVAANRIGGMNPRECYLLLAGHRGWLWFAPPGNMITAAVKIATANIIALFGELS